MKLVEIHEQTTRGTYAGCKFNPTTVAQLAAFTAEHNIPNAVDSSKFHSTILYSRKYLPNYSAAGKYPTPLVGTFTKFDVWQSKDGANCLVLEYSCPELVKRHNELMATHGATYDFPNYKTHVTLSYNIGDFDWKHLPAYSHKLLISEEYQEDLDLDWATTQGNKK